jgi:MYXO-CTERM domain-containing protein
MWRADGTAVQDATAPVGLLSVGLLALARRQRLAV